MPFRYAGANNGGNNEQQLYYEEREKNQRGNSFQRGSRGQPQVPSPRFDPEQRDPRYRNGFRTERDRFQKYNEPEAFEDDDDVEEANPHVSRRDRMKEREMGPPTPQQNRHLMRHSEDRQMGQSPRYQRPGGSLNYFILQPKMTLNFPQLRVFSH